MSDFVSFIWPAMLFSLLLLPVAIWLTVRLRRRQTIAMSQASSLQIAQSEPGQRLAWRRRLPVALYFAALFFLLLSLARPQMTVRVPCIQGTVILAFDVSNSMMADDLEPSRIEAARAAAEAFVDNQPATIQIGVVAFSNGGLIIQQPTHDRTAVLDAVARLTPQGGTSLGQGIFTSLNAIAGETLAIEEEAIDVELGTIEVDRIALGDYSSSVILLLSDGENMGPPEPLAIAQVAAEAGVRVYSIGIGSEAGTVIEVDGFNLVTALDEAMLQEIASLSNGAYFHADDAESLREIYENVDLQLTIEGEMMEITALLAGISLLLLLAGGLLSMHWFGRIP